MQELILNVYEEYKRFCEKTKKEPIKDLQIKKVETVTAIQSTAWNLMLRSLMQVLYLIKRNIRV